MFSESGVQAEWADDVGLGQIGIDFDLAKFSDKILLLILWIAVAGNSRLPCAF
jgi:hypothetical protein